MTHAHVLQLARKHRALDARIQDEQRRPIADATALRSLKRQKLRLKEALAQAEAPA